MNKIYERWFWMTKFSLVENNERFFNRAVMQCIRMERLYGDIFADVRTEVARKFIHTPTGLACKFEVTGA